MDEDELRREAAYDDALDQLAIAPGLFDTPLLGSLPEAAFREYLIQDYRFLVHFARAHALDERSLQVVQGSAAEVLPRHAAERRADLMVMGAVSRSRLREIFIGSTAERVLDHLPCDVLVVKAEDFRENLPF